MYIRLLKLQVVCQLIAVCPFRPLFLSIQMLVCRSLVVCQLIAVCPFRPLFLSIQMLVCRSLVVCQLISACPSRPLFLSIQMLVCRSLVVCQLKHLILQFFGIIRNLVNRDRQDAYNFHAACINKSSLSSSTSVDIFNEHILSSCTKSDKDDIDHFCLNAKNLG